MKLSSPVFENGEKIPGKYTCEGEDANPPLAIEGVPESTKSLAIVVDDPDAPMKTWVHWVVWNIPPETNDVPEKASIGKVGVNDFGRPGYGGPCPPPGSSHAYRFKLYALDTKLELKEGATRAELEEAMAGHILTMAEFTGTFQR